MEEMNRPKGALFAKLDGAPAHWLIIAGLALTLFAPLIPSFKLAEVESSRVALEQVNALIELDLDEFKRTQEEQSKKDEEESKKDAEEASKDFQAKTSASAEDQTALLGEIEKREAARVKRAEDRKKRADESKKALDQKREGLIKQYDTVSLRRALLDAQASASGMRWPAALAWLGRVMLLVGLLVLTLQSEGLRQKVALTVLLVVLFVALSGVNLNFNAQGHLGVPGRSETPTQTTAAPSRP